MTTPTLRPSLSTNQTPTVLIVGAGPTGLALACDLARRGVSIRIIDSSPGPQMGSRGKGVQPRTLEVFEDLGIVDQVLSNGLLSMPIHMTGPDGQVTLGGSEPEDLRSRPDIPYTTSLTTPQWRIEDALRVRLEELGGSVEFGAALASFEQSGDGVSAVVETTGKPETIIAQWLVGCDGGHSIVRKLAGVPFVGDTLEDVRMIVADAEVEGLSRDAWYMWRQEDGFIGLCPLPSTNLFQYQATIAPGQNPELDPVNMQSLLEQRTGRSDVRISNVAWASLWRANIRIAERYRIGRVLIAGDAAHIHSPAGGQGMNTGIQDAYNLGWKLAAVASGASATLLDTYESERRQIAAQVLALSNSRLKQTMEQQGMPTRRDSSTIQLDVGYRGSRLAFDDRDLGALLRAGDRAPDATKLMASDREHRLFDLTRGGHFTLLNFGPAFVPEPAEFDLKIITVAENLGGADTVVDTEGNLARAYAATARTLVLIRPDGYIGLISDAGQTHLVAHYLRSI